MATTQNTYTGNGSTTNYSFTFPYLETTDIKVSVNGTPTTAYTLANATTVQFNSAPANGASIRIYRETDDTALSSAFYAGSAIRAEDLTDNFNQNLYVVQELNNYGLSAVANETVTGSYTFTQPVTVPTPTADTHAVTRAYVNNIVANGIGDGDKGDVTVSGSGSTITIDNLAVTTAKLDNSSVTSSKIANDTIVDADINSAAGISLSKLATGALPTLITVASANLIDGTIVDADVNASAGIVSTKLSFTQTGLNAISRTIDSKLKDVVSVKDFGAVGNGVLNDTVAIQNALNSGAKTVLLPSGTYLTTELTIPSGVSLVSYDSATIRAFAVCSSLLAGASGAVGITVYGLTIDGNGLAGYGMLFVGGSKLRVENNRVSSVTLDGIRVQATADARILSNTVSSVDNHGITLTSNVTNFSVSNNIVTSTGFAGIIFSAGQKGVISDNVIASAGAGGDGITGYHHENSDVAVTGNVITGCANHGMHVGGDRITVTGNTVQNSNFSGIYIGCNLNGSSSNPFQPSNSISVSNNSIDTTTVDYGLLIHTCFNCTVSGNTVHFADNHSVLIVDSTGVVLASNNIEDGQEAGFVLRNSFKCLVSGNFVNNPRTNGFRIEETSANNHFAGNSVYGSATTSTVWQENSGCDANTFISNVAKNYSGAIFSRAGTNSRWLLGYPNTTTIASAAALPIDTANDFFEVTGTTTITSILQAPVVGRKITLWFTDTLTLGGNINNIRLNGGNAFNAVNGSTMTLVGDGTNWREVGRGTAPV